jgi:hypothetical protein
MGKQETNKVAALSTENTEEAKKVESLLKENGIEATTQAGAGPSGNSFDIMVSKNRFEDAQQIIAQSDFILTEGFE